MQNLPPTMTIVKWTTVMIMTGIKNA